MIAAEIKAICDRIVAQRKSSPVLERVNQNVREGEDGVFVCAWLTDYEMYLVDREIGGESLAIENMKALMLSRKYEGGVQ